MNLFTSDPIIIDTIFKKLGDGSRAIILPFFLFINPAKEFVLSHSIAK